MTSFYETQLFEVDLDFSELPKNDSATPLRTDKVPVASLLLSAAAVTVVGVLALTLPYTSLTVAETRAEQTTWARGVPSVAVPEAHRQAAERFQRMFKAVPMTDTEKLPDPDFDL